MFVDPKKRKRLNALMSVVAVLMIVSMVVLYTVSYFLG